MTSSQAPAETVNVKGDVWEFDGTRTYTHRTGKRVYTITQVPGSTHHVLTIKTLTGYEIDSIEFDTFLPAASYAHIKIQNG